MSAAGAERRWQDLIVDHSQFPRHHGSLEKPTHHAEGENPLCGDRVRLYLDVGASGTIDKARFEATGCAISLASASLLATAIQGLKRDQALQLFDQARAMLTTGEAVSGIDDAELEALRLISRFPMRVKCASLCWHTLRQALRGAEGTVSTE
ncbi:MAG: SUF system NifU family Fe-S cluster assembly protein [Xanthomonadales bacterium]|nr:SUF system NifU family Fe-S cluster assembly protein [Xanthomonadales bacterium]NNL94074.1 SUF system NifU family Fe-S cluster assembly protein [Xanthomonadales bacterium]